jgi:hypothetical protein
MREVLLRNDKEGILPESSLLKAMVFGYLTFSSRDLQLGEFRTPDHAGCSVAWLKRRIDSLKTMLGFTVCPPKNHSGRFIIEGGPWDVKKKLQDAMADLNIDEWGLEYEDFKPTMGPKRPDSDLAIV